MVNLDVFINDAGAEDVGENQRRTVVTREDLKDRLAFYADSVEGLETTKEHMDILSAVFTDHANVFITGGAGTGKTTVVRSVIIPELDHRGLHWSVTATTGIAGSHLDGKTIHSFFGIGLGPEWEATYPRDMQEFMDNCPVGEETPAPQDMSDDELLAWYNLYMDRWQKDTRVNHKTRAGILRRLRTHEVLLIDEISMCPGDAMLGYLDFMLKEIRGSRRPFGGMQVIFIGDFAQLPPVDTRNVASRPDWAFLSRAWDNARVKSLELTRVFRQGDTRFIDFLNNIRRGVVTPEDRDYASQFVKTNMTLEETRNYTFLVPTNKQAHALNTAALDNYPAPTIPVDAVFEIVPELQDMTEWEKNKPERVKDALIKSLRLVSKTMFLRTGYPVMITVNSPDGSYVNGTRGFVREIHVGESRDANGRIRYEDDFIVVGVPSKEPGEGERLITLYRRVHTRERKQDPRACVEVPVGFNEATGNKLPETVTRYPSIRQFPVIPAVSITVHKCQGMSLDTAILALSKSFAAGQVYVGLSRLRSPKGLVLSEPDFEAKTDPFVTGFYRKIRE